jgi:1,4-dihydroxy-2-naphthoyl-CoA hydrolase
MSKGNSESSSMDTDQLQALGRDTISEALGLEILEVTHGHVTGRMPVDSRTHQPYGLLHGGASVVLAETLGSVGSHFIAAPLGKGAVGIEVNANHLRGVRDGWVHGTAKLHHEGGRLHIWHIEISDDKGRSICTSRLTVMLVPNVQPKTSKAS